MLSDALIPCIDTNSTILHFYTFFYHYSNNKLFLLHFLFFTFTFHIRKLKYPLYFFRNLDSCNHYHLLILFLIVKFQKYMMYGPKFQTTSLFFRLLLLLFLLHQLLLFLIMKMIEHQKKMSKNMMGSGHPLREPHSSKISAKITYRYWRIAFKNQF